MTLKDNHRAVRAMTNAVADIASPQVAMYIRRGEYQHAMQVLQDASAEHEKALLAIQAKSTHIPVEYCGVSKATQLLLQDAGYETVQDIIDHWPARIFRVGKMNVSHHIEIYRALTALGFSKLLSPLSSFRPNASLPGSRVPSKDSA